MNAAKCGLKALRYIARAVLMPTIEATRLYLAMRRFPCVVFDGYAHVGRECKIAAGVRICDRAIIESSAIGRHTYVGGRTHCRNATIGSFCSIACDVLIGLGIHPTDRVSTHPAFYSASRLNRKGLSSYHVDHSVIEYRPVLIGHDVWVGARAIVMDGVSIGTGAVVASAAVVTRDVPPYAIVAGVPARVIGWRRDEAERVRLLRSCWWERSDEWLAANGAAFSTCDRLIEICEKEDLYDE